MSLEDRFNTSGPFGALFANILGEMSVLEARIEHFRKDVRVTREFLTEHASADLDKFLAYYSLRRDANHVSFATLLDMCPPVVSSPGTFGPI